MQLLLQVLEVIGDARVEEGEVVPVFGGEGLLFKLKGLVLLEVLDRREKEHLQNLLRNEDDR